MADTCFLGIHAQTCESGLHALGDSLTVDVVALEL